MDILELLGPDISMLVFNFITNPADLIRTTAVSRSWNKFVNAQKLIKQLCLRICPNLLHFSSIKEITPPGMTQEDGYGDSMEQRNHERDKLIYSYLLQCIVPSNRNKNCIRECIGASSTNVPSETIENTLEIGFPNYMGPSFWSSAGETDPSLPEFLIYRLRSRLSVIHEIRIRPLKGFQPEEPVYSSQAVRFRIGYYKVQHWPVQNMPHDDQFLNDEKFVWTYISPEFPMSQSFKLRQPIVSIGDVIKIELIGRAQKLAANNLYYICLTNVQVIGRPLSPVLGVDFPKGDGDDLVLKYFPDQTRDALLI
ncbi:F-box protein [Rhynchospora pubera]|uniref:F-box protein n=1 Tax=Rhynchospora pubera TaxID=906938 RepID=A0AAV8E800_9POAL|nr:F-box protein [Rhynchospora pubera]